MCSVVGTCVPSAHLSALGTTVQPRRTPVKPAYLENEFTYRIRTTDRERQESDTEKGPRTRGQGNRGHTPAVSTSLGGRGPHRMKHSHTYRAVLHILHPGTPSLYSLTL